MTSIYSSDVTKKLALQYLLDNIDYRKRSQYLQEIISLGRKSDVWRQALTTFLNTPAGNFSPRAFSKN